MTAMFTNTKIINSFRNPISEFFQMRLFVSIGACLAVALAKSGPFVVLVRLIPQSEFRIRTCAGLF
jgi:hypothetical protein